MNAIPDKPWHALDAAQAASLLGADTDKGLTPGEAEERGRRFGPNALTPRKGKSALTRFLLQFHQPLVYILILSGVVTAALGEVVDSSVIIGVVLINAVVGYIQEAKAAGALEALAKSMVMEASVVRGGAERRLPAASLAPGDVVVLRSGDKVPADLRLFSVKNLKVDESALTGESVPVEKDPAALAPEFVLAERRNMAYAATLVTYGQALGLVTAIGDATQIGRIQTMVSQADELATPLTRRIERFSSLLLWAILGLAALTFAAGVMRGESAVHMLTAAVALAVGAIPEGLPAAVTIILAIGVSRMAARGAIIRRLPAVETLGGATVICSDKTGTLTKNQMTVTRIFAGGHEHGVTGSGYLPDGVVEGVSARGETRVVWPAGGETARPLDGRSEALRMTLLAGLLCNDSRITFGDGEPSVEGDPTEAALLVSAAKAGFDADILRAGTPRLDTLPFESEHQYMATLHAGENGAPPLAFFKGSVESALERADRMLLPDGGSVPLDAGALRDEAARMASGGLRVLAMAMKEMPAGKAALSHEDVSSGLVFLGLQGMIDPPRPEAVEAVEAFKRAGVAVKMITGDHAVTAAAIGAQLGLAEAARPDAASCRALTGADLAAIPDEELSAVAGQTAVFARVAPEQKLRLVKALQSLGHVAAMTGDGVNDAPALKQADIGVAMGRGGTEAAKEASDMVLTDDNFATIRAAVEEGRGVYDNLIKFIVWTLPTNLGEGLVILVAVLLGVSLPILPVQILWINMTTATALGLMLAFEPKEPGIMDRPPRDTAKPILDRALFSRIVLVGALLLVASFGLYQLELRATGDEAQARTVAVNVFVVIESFYLFNSRSFTLPPSALGFWSNPWVPAGCGIMLILQLAFTYVPAMNTLFGSAPVGLDAWLKALAAGAVAYVVVEAEKKLRRMKASA